MIVCRRFTTADQMMAYANIVVDEGAKIISVQLRQNLVDNDWWYLIFDGGDGQAIDVADEEIMNDEMKTEMWIQPERIGVW